MGRRFGMWMAIICILVVGVSVTKMTKDFVSSNGVEAAAISSVMDISTPLTSGMSAVESAMEGFSSRAAGTEGGAGDTGSAVAGAAGTSSDAEAAADGTAKEAADPEMARLALARTEAPEAEAAPEEDAAKAETAPEAYESGADRSEEAMTSGAVKSPLDPAVEPEGPFAEEKRAQEESDSETFLERFALAEASSEALWDKVSLDNAGASYTAAEQEHLLWDHELNLVYSTIRSGLSEDEAEELKALELEWMKERDLYANKSMSPGKSKSLQSSDYLRALTEKTRERCYWLVDEYKEVLDSKE